jgi:hypothetical protein
MGADNPFRMMENISALTVADWSRKLQHCCPKSRSRRRNLLGTQQRVTANADVCNKDRTYLKALAVKTPCRSMSRAFVHDRFFRFEAASGEFRSRNVAPMKSLP